jgi:hypothetical protein
MACLIRYEPESLISETLNKVNSMRNLSNQVPGGSSTQLTNSCTSDTSTEPSSMATIDSMAQRHSVSDTSSTSQCAKIFLRL